MTSPAGDLAQPPTRGRRALFTAIYLVALGAFLLVGVEIISRMVFPPQLVSVHVSNEIAYDPEIGWRGARNFSAAVPHGKYPVPVQVDINADGFRDESWDAKLARAQARGSKRILILGDSLLYGWANPVDGRLSEQLRAHYQPEDGDVEVFNAGIPAYGPHNQLRLLPELLSRLHPHEVVLLFCNNDLGNAALPYSLNASLGTPTRIYQPFYDAQARLLFNARVPRRPSLAMRDTVLGGLHLWYSADQLRYALDDWRYGRYGIPNPRNAPVQDFEFMLGNPTLRARFPYVMATLLSEYSLMARLCREAGARFTFFSSVEHAPPTFELVADVLGRGLAERGVRFLVPPHDDLIYGLWRSTLHDGHPNFVWAWILASGLYASLQDISYRLDFAEMPQMRDVPTELDLGNEAASVRFLGLGWDRAGGTERRLTGRASVFLRRPAAGPADLEVVGWAPQPTPIRVVGPEERELCRLTFTLPASTYHCPIAAGIPLVFVHFMPDSDLDSAHFPAISRIALRAVTAG